jgi:hypothetical protein
MRHISNVHISRVDEDVELAVVKEVIVIVEHIMEGLSVVQPPSVCTSKPKFSCRFRMDGCLDLRELNRLHQSLFYALLSKLLH